MPGTDYWMHHRSTRAKNELEKMQHFPRHLANLIFELKVLGPLCWYCMAPTFELSYKEKVSSIITQLFMAKIAIFTFDCNSTKCMQWQIKMILRPYFCSTLSIVTIMTCMIASSRLRNQL
jgi:hypothetical protein